MAATPDVPWITHSNPVTQAGFTMIPNLVMLRRDISPLAKLVYGYLKHLAWRNGGRSSVPLLEISHDLDVSQRALQGYLRELRDAPVFEGGGPDVDRLVVSERHGMGLPNTYVINDAIGYAILPNGMASAATPSGEPRQTSRERDPSRGQDLEPKKISPLTSPRPENRPATVARKPVTDDEYATASLILQRFNGAAGTRYTSVDWVAKIVSRIREHPELPVEAHAIVIDRVLAEPWWQGDPSPSVIYGNAGIFERSVHAVRTQPEERSLTPDEILKLRG